MLSDKIKYSHKSPDGKSVYRIRLNDLLSKEFLLETSLSDFRVGSEKFQSNLNKRVDKIREIAKSLNTVVDFNQPNLFFEMESYNLEKIRNFLPHLI
jgi:hypothetical protein